MGDLRTRFGNLGLAAAAYNAGPQRLQDWLSGRGALPKETRHYVQIVTGHSAEEWTGGTNRANLELPEPMPCRDVAKVGFQTAAKSDSGIEKAPANNSFQASPAWGVQLVGSPSQASALASFAIEGLKANEGDAIKAFSDKNNDQFHVLDLYVFCINLADGKFTSQLDQSLVGTSAESLRYGQDQYGKRLLSTLREAPEGKVISVAYNALRPGTKSGAVPKVSFVARIGKKVAASGITDKNCNPRNQTNYPHLGKPSVVA